MSQPIEIAGVRLTHPDRVLFAEQGLTKQDLIEYYRKVERLMLPHLSRRILRLVRCPEGQRTGVDGKGCFFQKHASAGMPESLKQIAVEARSGERKDYLYLEGFSGVVAGVQMGTLEFHVWGSGIADIERPTRIVFDLDPDPTVGFARVRDAAYDLRELLLGLGLESFPMLTGGKGIHVIVPFSRRAGWPAAKAFAHAVASSFAEAAPDRFVATAAKAARVGRIFIDYLRNERGATAIAPYSTRARPGAPVAAPVGWAELQRIHSAAAFDVRSMMRRVGRGSSTAWEGWNGALRQSLTEKRLARLGIAP